MCCALNPRMCFIESYIEKHKYLWRSSEDNKHFDSLQVFMTEVVGPWEIGLLLGLFETKGSILSGADPFSESCFLPSLLECVTAFCNCQLPKEKTAFRKGVKPSILTSGARALAKHCHRDLSESFWPTLSGSEDNRNRIANKTLAHIISDIAWMNLHFLPVSLNSHFILPILMLCHLSL
ncbi:hypothetical protein DSO57_1032280 [Entomophthora muscae]|uniref:Uncharacterized protein n=1 Tax=Entomophthora muscae TaxID=34485 RepID=A0ACC2SPU7_9FUNG|nr:hypothetical protein DSO57_1032280 [Entomophthora muscae]